MVPKEQFIQIVEENRRLTKDVEQAAAKIEKLLGDCASLGARLAEAQALCREAANYIQIAFDYGFGDHEIVDRLRAMGGE